MSKKNENVNINVETPVEKQVTEPIYGVVTLPKEYKKLNIREEAKSNAKVLCTVGPKTKMQVNTSDATPNWVKVTTKDGIVGYCMKKYISIK